MINTAAGEAEGVALAGAQGVRERLFRRLREQLAKRKNRPRRHVHLSSPRQTLKQRNGAELGEVEQPAFDPWPSDKQPAMRSALSGPGTFPIDEFAQKVIFLVALFESVLERHREEKLRRRVGGQFRVVAKFKEESPVVINQRVIERHSPVSRA